MKKIMALMLLCTVLISCGGSDGDGPTPNNPNDPSGDELTLGDFSLIFPDNNLICSEGEDLENGQLGIDFQWEASENATSYTLELTNNEANTTETFSSTTNNIVIPVVRGTQFSWKVTAERSNSTKDSAEWNFFSEGTAIENFAPFPAEITVVDNLDGTVNISWSGADLDDDIANYSVIAEGVQQAILTQTTDTELNNHQITYGTAFTVEVVTFDMQGNTSINKQEFIFFSN